MSMYTLHKGDDDDDDDGNNNNNNNRPYNISMPNTGKRTVYKKT